MKARELQNLGFPRGEAVQRAIQASAQAATAGLDRTVIRNAMAALAKDPEAFRAHPIFGAVATALLAAQEAQGGFVAREGPAPYRQWGDDCEAEAIKQMTNACRLPVSVRGALMPDAHVGYGLPIGGVLATRNAVVPYAVGMDIACRMKLTVLDLPPATLSGQGDRLKNALERETGFGVGATFRKRREHPVMDADWSVSPVTKMHKDRAWGQLGTSGSGNHFVEFGTLTFEQDDLGLPAGVYLALLSHSGSRGTGDTDGRVLLTFSCGAFRGPPRLADARSLVMPLPSSAPETPQPHE
jgi:tRNA-splicing ligase RtcB